MCIIIYKPQGIAVNRITLEACFQNNPDGAGYMYPCEGRLLIQKGFFEFEDFNSAWEKTRKIHSDELPMVLHFRIATAGEIDKRNCHPHRITPDLGFVHNGILSCITVPKTSKLSDTILYRNLYLGKLSGDSLSNGKLFRAIGRHIGAGNKFVFMNGAGKAIICNEEQGIWKDGLWFSNHSFLPRTAFPFSSRTIDWCCEYCGNVLVLPEELAEGVCSECLTYFESDYAECAGCQEQFISFAHRELGWCDNCGYDIYGRDWPGLLRETAASINNRFHEWF